jgi:hypothetical protein
LDKRRPNVRLASREARMESLSLANPKVSNVLHFMKRHQLLTIIRDLVLYFSGLLLPSFVALQPRAERIIPPARAVNKGVIYARRTSHIVLTIWYKF